MTKRQLMTVLQLGLIPPAVAGAWLAPGWLPVGFAMWFLFGCVGVTVTFHRLMAHRAFEAPAWFVRIGSLLGFLATTVTPIEWAANHPDHHRFADRPGDPHSPLILGWRVAFFAFHGVGKPPMSARRLMEDRWMAWLQHHQAIVLCAYIAACFGAAGWRGVVFLWAIPSLLSLWSVILSVLAHDGEGPKTLGWALAILTWGEHRHADHHRNPRDWSGDWPASWVIRLVSRRA